MNENYIAIPTINSAKMQSKNPASIGISSYKDIEREVHSSTDLVVQDMRGNRYHKYCLIFHEIGKQVKNEKHKEFLTNLQEALRIAMDEPQRLTELGISIHANLDGFSKLGTRVEYKTVLGMKPVTKLVPIGSKEEQEALLIQGKPLRTKAVKKAKRHIEQIDEEVSASSDQINEWLNRVCNNFHPLYRNVNKLIEE